jgi:hypothetical protein
MYISKQQQNQQNQKEGPHPKLWFEKAFYNGVLTYQLGMNHFSEDDVEQTAWHLSRAGLKSITNVSTCGSVLTIETNIPESEYKQALHRGDVNHLLGVLRLATTAAIQRVCPYKPQDAWFDADQKRVHFDRYAHKRPGTVIVIA